MLRLLRSGQAPITSSSSMQLLNHPVRTHSSSSQRVRLHYTTASSTIDKSTPANHLISYLRILQQERRTLELGRLNLHPQRCKQLQLLAAPQVHFHPLCNWAASQCSSSNNSSHSPPNHQRRHMLTKTTQLQWLLS